MVLDRPHGGDQHGGRWGQLAEPADDVEELLHPHVRAEARLGHHVVAELHPDQVGHQRVVAVRDVGERAAVHHHRLALERLDQVGLERVLEQHRHRARRAEVLGGDRLGPIKRVGRRDVGDAPAQVLEIPSDGHDRHHLRRRGDVKAGLAGIAVRPTPQAHRNVAQRPVVHVHGTAPADRERIDAELVPVQQVRFEHRGEQVVRSPDRVDVAGEVKVKVLHRDDLGEAAARGAALDSEHRADRGLAQAGHGVLADHA